jgi:hypothetical protein
MEKTVMMMTMVMLLCSFNIVLLWQTEQPPFTLREDDSYHYPLPLWQCSLSPPLPNIHLPLEDVEGLETLSNMGSLVCKT